MSKDTSAADAKRIGDIRQSAVELTAIPNEVVEFAIVRGLTSEQAEQFFTDYREAGSVTYAESTFGAGPQVTEITKG
mgnify:FL=1